MVPPEQCIKHLDCYNNLHKSFPDGHLLSVLYWNLNFSFLTSLYFSSQIASHTALSVAIKVAYSYSNWIYSLTVQPLAQIPSVLSHVFPLAHHWNIYHCCPLPSTPYISHSTLSLLSAPIPWGGLPSPFPACFTLTSPALWLWSATLLHISSDRVKPRKCAVLCMNVHEDEGDDSTYIYTYFPEQHE